MRHQVTCVYTAAPNTLHFSEGGAYVSGACVFRVRERRYARAGGIVDVQLFAPGRVYFVLWRTLAGGDFIS